MERDPRPADPRVRGWWLLPPKITIGFASAVLVVIAGALVSTQALSVRRHNVTQVNHTFATLMALEQLLGAVKDGETGQRGYLLTGDDRYLHPYADSERDATSALAHLRDLMANETTHGDRLDRLEPIVRAKFVEMDRTIQLRREGHPEEALSIVQSGEGMRLMHDIRDLVETTISEESQVLEEHQRTWTRSVFASNTIFVAADVVLLVLILLAAKLVRAEIAEREAAAVERARMLELQQQLMAIVGHDLRSPLSAVLTSASMLVRAPDVPPARARNAERIVTSARRMERIIRDLLDYTRLRVGGGIPIAPIATDFGTIVRKVIEELELEHRDRKVDWRVEGDLRGEWDPDRLEQVVSNLVSNALRHGAEGTPVRVRARSLDGEIAMEVHNEGNPIPEELLPHLFEPFRRGTREGDSGRGLGLGLFIVGNVVAAHGGSIDVRSSPEVGTTFRVRLPRHPADTRGDARVQTA